MEWYEIYAQLAKYFNQLYLKYGDDAGAKLYEAYKKRDPNFKELSWVGNFKEYNVTSLDPLHIFASFNYYKISSESRKKRMILFCELLEDNNISTNGLKSTIDKINDIDVFKDFPHINITHTVAARSNETQRDVWKLFSLVHKNDKTNIEEYFNMSSDWYGVDIPSLTIFMFWVNSSNFMPLDKNTEALLRRHKVIDTFPNNYQKYLKLINKNDTSLYRTLAKVAIDENVRYELTDDEKQELDDFLNSKVSKREKKQEDKQTKTLNIEHIPNFDFELYILTNGIARRIRCRGKKINRYDELEITVKDKKLNKINYTYPDFQIIAIRVFKSNYINGLELRKCYYFTQNFEIVNNQVVLKNTDTLKLYSGYNINNINITAVVGKNGTGKSTIAELLVMAINNFSYILQHDEEHSLNELKDLFYTIYTNYSLHALNERHYEGEWLKKLFHKNDGYQTPVVIEPYREEGIIDVNVLESLTKQRLLAAILKKSVDNEDFTILTEGRRATHLDISIDMDKFKKVIDDYNNNLGNIHTKSSSCNENQLILDFFFDKGFIDRPSSFIFFPIEPIDTKNKLLPRVKDIAVLYLCYKVREINKTYHKQQKIDEGYLGRFLYDKSHITFKLHQVMNFLRFSTIKDLGKISIKRLSDDLSAIKNRNNIESIMEVLPPSFFKVDIIIDDDIPFSKLSSGEKQEIYTTSSIVYHLQNIESVHQGNSDRIAYKNVNIILDEIELYFHPDMQRKFIYNLLQAIENKGGFNYISGLNIMMITHSPFILSDILKDNILYLSNNENKNSREELGDTFASNIHTLLDNSFFMDDGLMGKFAKKKINEIIKELNELYAKSKDIENEDIDIFEKASRTRREEMRRIIENIGEPFLKRKLSDMYIKVFESKKTPLEMLEDERKNLDKRIERLKNDSNKRK